MKLPEFEKKEPGKLYALKYLEFNSENSKMALDEVVFLKHSLENVNVLDCYDAFLSKESKCLVMVNELCVCSLAEVMFEPGFAKDERFVVECFLQCAKALKYIHSK